MPIATQQNIFENKALDPEKFDKSFPKSKISNRGLTSSYDPAHPYNTANKENSNLSKIGKNLYGKGGFTSDSRGIFIVQTISKNNSGAVVHGNLLKADIDGFRAKTNAMTVDIK